MANNQLFFYLTCTRRRLLRVAFVAKAVNETDAYQYINTQEGNEKMNIKSIFTDLLKL